MTIESISLLEQSDLGPVQAWLDDHASVQIVSISFNAGTFYIIYK